MNGFVTRKLESDPEGGGGGEKLKFQSRPAIWQRFWTLWKDGHVLTSSNQKWSTYVRLISKSVHGVLVTIPILQNWAEIERLLARRTPHTKHRA